MLLPQQLRPSCRAPASESAAEDTTAAKAEGVAWMVPQHQYQKLAMMLNRKHVSLWSCWVGMRRRHIGGKLKHTRRQRPETEPAVAGVDMEIGIEKQCPDHK